VHRVVSHSSPQSSRAATSKGRVRVERLARDLRIAKSGFYWHFEDRNDLLQQLLDYWEHEFTEVVSENPELRRLEPRERLTRVAELVLEHDLSGFDLSFRAWAAHDRLVARRANRVIRKRLDYIGEAFAELGFEGQDLDMRTRLFVCYTSAERATYPGVSKKALRELLPLRLELLTGSNRQQGNAG
jgi:AcrR family transcriptional regulator